MSSDADHKERCPSAARAARRTPGGQEEACLRTVASTLFDMTALLTARATELRGGAELCLFAAWCASHPRAPAGMVNPDVVPLDWRAVCGKTARTVRREGRA